MESEEEGALLSPPHLAYVNSAGSALGFIWEVARVASLQLPRIQKTLDRIIHVRTFIPSLSSEIWQIHLHHNFIFWEILGFLDDNLTLKNMEFMKE